MAELVYGHGEVFELGTTLVSVGTDKTCNLVIERDTGDAEADLLAAAVAAAAAAAAAAGASGAGIIAPSAEPVDLGERFFSIQWHEPGHILKDCTGKGGLKVNGKPALLHRLVDHDLIEADGEEFEYQNGNMPPGSWEVIEKKKGTRSMRWVPAIIAMAALIVVLCIQWMQYGHRKAAEMEEVKTRQKTISMDEAQVIIADLSKTKEERLAEMSPEDLRRIRENFLLDEDATEEEKEANLAALAELFGVEHIDELLDGGSAEDIMAMLDDGGSGKLTYVSEEQQAEEDEMIAEMFLHSGGPEVRSGSGSGSGSSSSGSSSSGSKSSGGSEGGGSGPTAQSFLNLSSAERKLIAQMGGGSILPTSDESSPPKKKPRTAEDVMLAEIFRHKEDRDHRGEADEEKDFEWLATADRELFEKVSCELAEHLESIGFGKGRLPAAQAAALRYHHVDAVTGYLEQGHRSDAWDADVIAAIDVDARLRTTKSMAGRLEARKHLGELVKKSLDAGCRDPNLLLIREDLVQRSSADLSYEGSGTDIENVALMVSGLETYRWSPLVRSRIYLYGVETVLEFVRGEGETRLKGMPLEVWMKLPAAMGGWEKWVERGLKDVVAGAPRLSSPNLRDAYSGLLKDVFKAFSQARGEHESVVEALSSGLERQEGGTEVMETLSAEIERFQLQSSR